MAALVVIGVFAAVLLQQQASATIANHNKCSSDDIIICTHNKETLHPAKDTTTPFVLPIPFP
jgi:hypothetical protein